MGRVCSSEQEEEEEEYKRETTKNQPGRNDLKGQAWNFERDGQKIHPFDKVEKLKFLSLQNRMWT